MQKHAGSSELMYEETFTEMAGERVSCEGNFEVCMHPGDVYVIRSDISTFYNSFRFGVWLSSAGIEKNQKQNIILILTLKLGELYRL